MINPLMVTELQQGGKSYSKKLNKEYLKTFVFRFEMCLKGEFFIQYTLNTVELSVAIIFFYVY